MASGYSILPTLIIPFSAIGLYMNDVDDEMGPMGLYLAVNSDLYTVTTTRKVNGSVLCVTKTPQSYQPLRLAG